MQSSAQSGLLSLNATKSCVPIPSQTMLFFFEPLNSNRPNSGFRQWMPSRLSA